MGTPGNYNPLLVVWVYDREVAFEEDYGLVFCKLTCSEVWEGKARIAVASDQTNL